MNESVIFKKAKKPGLTAVILISLILGAAAGTILHYLVPDGYIKDTILTGGIFYVIGNGFIRLMQMLVVPLVFCSLVCGSMAMGDTKSLGKIGVKTLGFYLFTTAAAIALALGLGVILSPGTGLDISSLQPRTQDTAVTERANFADTLLEMIPRNPVESLVSGNMLQIIIFALIVGVLLAKRGKKAAAVSQFVSQFNDLMMDMTMAVMKLAPFGVFCLTAKTFSSIGFDAFGPLLKYTGCVLLALLVQCTAVYQLLLFFFTRLNPLLFLKKFIPVMGFAFSTAASNATIPLSVDTLSRRMGVEKRISSFTIPLGATINMDGTSIMQGVAVVFVAQAYGIPLEFSDYLTVIAAATVASIGTAGVPGVGLVTLSMVFSSVGLPVEGIGIIMGIDRILDMARTAVNITGDAVCTAIVASQEGALDRKVFHQKESV